MKTPCIAVGMLLAAIVSPGATARGQDLTLTVQPGVKRDDPAFAERSRLAERMTAAKLQPPPGRTGLFAWESGAPDPPVQGWSGIIKSFERVPGNGVIVSVSIHPRFDTAMFDSIQVIERYLVTDQEVRFLDATGPSPGTPRLLIGV